MYSGATIYLAKRKKNEYLLPLLWLNENPETDHLQPGLIT